MFTCFHWIIINLIIIIVECLKNKQNKRKEESSSVQLTRPSINHQSSAK